MEGKALLFLADAVLAIHFLFAGYISLGFATIWLGYFLDWKFVRAPWFRYSHAGAMGIVVLESVCGVFCPLTEWEYRLCQLAGEEGRYETSFMDYWAQKVFYFDLSETAFLLIYIAFFILILLTFLVVPVRST